MLDSTVSVRYNITIWHCFGAIVGVVWSAAPQGASSTIVTT